MLNGYYRSANYETTFKHGTGYYKDFYPDDALQVEGALIEGKKDGQWKYYEYNNGNNTKIYIENYEKGKLISKNTFYSNDLMEKAIAWEHLPKRKRKYIENLYTGIFVGQNTFDGSKMVAEIIERELLLKRKRRKEYNPFMR